MSNAFRLLIPLALVILAVLGLEGVRTAVAEPAALVAERITEANFPTHHVGGPDADAGIGDWFLGNGTICAAVSDPEHESPLTSAGGVLIDIGHCGADDDQWVVIQPMLNLSQAHAIPVDKVETGTTVGEAWIRTHTVFLGVEITTTYSVSSSEPNALRVHTRATRTAPGEAFFSLGQILLHTSGQTRPFALLRGNPEASPGFRYPPSDRHSLISMIGALVASDVNILVGAEGMPPISYGIEQLGGTLVNENNVTIPLRRFAVTGLHFTSFNTLSAPPWLGSDLDAPSLVDLARVPFMDLGERSSIESEVRIWVGERADVASITDQLWTKAPRIRGRVDEPDARVHIDTEFGAPVTEVRPDALGHFELSLPVGRYRARVRARGARETSMPFHVAAASDAAKAADGATDASVQTLPAIQVGAASWLELPSDFVGRLVFIDEQTDRPVVFGQDLLGFQIGNEAMPSAEEAPFLNLAGIAEDPRRVAMPAGRYRVLAVRGPEYALVENRVTTRIGETTQLSLPPLERVRPTPDWIAADLHVHSGDSFDSGLPPTRQLAAFAASGAEVLVATEHDRIVDPRISLAETGLSNRLVKINGVEITSAFEGGDSPHSTGHWNAFPVTYQPGVYRGGAPSLEGRRAHDAIADVRALPGKPFLQLNHPRPGLNEGEGDTFFAHMGVAGVPYDPAQRLTDMPNSVLGEKGPTHGLRDIDYDGVELLNGPDLLRYRRVRADWFSLLLQGESRVATSNSDSHRLGVIVGLPRTYVRMPEPSDGGGDAIAGFDEAAFMRALASGQAYGSTGPLLDVRLGESGIGALHTGETGILEVRVDAAEWVPLDEARVYVNGELVHREPVAAGQTLKLPLVFARDAFVTVEVEGPDSGLYARVLPGFVPFAFTNPIFVDADGDGRFEAPGYPSLLPPSLTDPDRED